MTARFEYQPLPDLDDPLRVRLGRYPRQPDLLLEVLRALGRTIAVLLFRAQFRLEVVGRPPDDARVALLANHSSHLDSLAVLAALPERQRRRLAVLAAADHFFERLPRAIAASLFGQGVAFDRRHYTELRRWTRLLREQEQGWLLVYPSGSRRRSDAHDAILFVFSRSGWPLVPVAIAGTREAWPPDSKLWRPFRRIRVTFGEPLPAGDAAELRDRLAAFWQEHGR